MVPIVPSPGKFYFLAFSSGCLIKVSGVAVSLVLWFGEHGKFFPSIWRNMVSVLSIAWQYSYPLPLAVSA